MLTGIYKKKPVNLFSLKNIFYGHGAFSECAKLVLFSGVEFLNQTLEARLFLFDFQSQKLIDTIPFVNGFSHDIVNIKDQQFIISSGSKMGEGQFVFFDLSKKDFKTIKISQKPKQNSSFEKQYGLLVTSLVHLKKAGHFIFANLQYINNKASDFLGHGCIVKLNLNTCGA